MTLKYMQGFETMRDDTDFRAQGWVASPTKQYVVPAPSLSGLVGTSLQVLGPAASSAGTVPGAAGATDPGYFNTGVTINQAWLAGGFTFGCRAKFNSTINAVYGSTIANNSSGICFDGSKYWAIKAVGATYNVATSTDLINWTVTSAQPATATGTGTTISYLGGGVVAVCPVNASSAIVYTSSNNGASWTSTTITSGSQNTFAVSAGGTGNSSYPHYVMCAGVPNAGTPYPILAVSVGTLGGTMTVVFTTAPSTATAGTSYAGPCKTIGSLIVCSGWQGTGNNGAYSTIAMAPSASAGTAASWTTATASGYPNSTLPIINDIIFCPASNVYLLATSAGISTMPNGAGTAGVPNQVATGGYTLISRYSTVGMQRVFLSGSTYVAVGLSGHIITSPDGITWTESGGHLLPVGVSGYDWRSAIYDGSRYVLCSDATTGMIATTPDLITNYAAVYVSEPTEASAGYAGTLGVFGAPAFTSGTFTSGNNLSLSVAAAASGARTITLYSLNNSKGTFSVPTTNLYHYYEIVATPVSGTSNNFTVQVFVDGLLALTGTSGAQFGTAGDTTTIIGLQLGRNGAFTAWDDMYFTVNDGHGVSGQVGIINIVAQRPETDTQAQWTKTGSAASNSLSVNQPALSSLSSNYVASSNAGDKDIYGTTDALPFGYTPKAIQNEAYFTRTSTTTPIVNIGTLSGSTEVDGAGASIVNATPTYVSQILENDPNGSSAWTAASVNAAKFVLNHTS